MNRAGHEARLVEQYIDDLLVNQDAPPPAELDDETAFVVRALVITRELDLPEDDAEERIWNRILFALYLKPDTSVQCEALSERVMLPVGSFKREKKEEVVRSKLRHVPNGQPHRLSWLIAARKGPRQSYGTAMLIATVLAVIIFTGMTIQNLVLTTPNLETERQAPAAVTEPVTTTDAVKFDPGLESSMQVWNEEFAYEDQRPVRLNGVISLTPYTAVPQ